MPRGRHRHSPPLHRMLPPVAVAGASALCAVGSWTLVDPVMLRTLVAAAAAAAGTGAVMMRLWDREAGRQVADLTRARAHDAWQSEERIAELETDVEESRELRVKLDAKLRAKRVELAALRGEHAALLRRYATAETERAGALEERRQLTIEVAAPKALALIGSTPTADVFLRAKKALDELTDNATAQRERRQAAEAGPQDSTEPAGGESAAESTDVETAGVESAGVESAGAEATEATDEPDAAVEESTDATPKNDRPESDQPKNDRPKNDRPKNDQPESEEPVAAADEVDGPRQEPAAEVETEHTDVVPAEHTRPAVAPARRSAGARAIAPYGPRRLPEPRPEGGFNFFGAQRAAGTVPPQREGAPSPEDTGADEAETPGPTAALPSHAPRSASVAASPTVPQQAAPPLSPPSRVATQPGLLDDVHQEDLADVVGEETLAAQRTDPARAVGDVIDLTVHEEPQQGRVPVGKLRKAVGS
ncbi:hypothetical protein ABZ348_18190 [Streptomyces sp. NPDC005963]|uniref:hypothetical protein n=1 Tax=Streptomyces sp. NPDC005963 TaxID=3156721 RepID=UPI00341116B8